MVKNVDSTLCTKACANIDVTEDLKKHQGKCIAELINEETNQEDKEEEQSA